MNKYMERCNKATVFSLPCQQFVLGDVKASIVCVLVCVHVCVCVVGICMCLCVSDGIVYKISTSSL